MPQYVSIIFIFGGFVYRGLGARLVADFGGRVLGCGDTPVSDILVSSLNVT